MITLYVSQTTETGLMTLPQALKICQDVFNSRISAFALLYAPRWCRFAKPESTGILTDSSGQLVEVDEVFEARIFSNAAELRWLHVENGLGRAVLLSESKHNCFESEDEVLCLEGIDGTYLVWGQGVKPLKKSGWSRLATARIGPLDVPLENVGANQYVHIVTREYIVTEPKFGNAYIFDERLLRLEVAQ